MKIALQMLLSILVQMQILKNCELYFHANINTSQLWTLSQIVNCILPHDFAQDMFD